MGNKEINRYDPHDIQRYAWGKYFQQDLDVSEVTIRIEIKNDNRCYFIFSQRDKGPILVKGPCSGTGSMNVKQHPTQELEKNSENLEKVTLTVINKTFDFENFNSFWDHIRT